MLLRNIKTSFLTMFLFAASIVNAQINKDLKIKISTGLYGLASLTDQYDAYRFDLSLNYSLGLVKDFKLNANGNWALRSELLYNRTIVKNGEDELKDKFKMDHLLVPIKIVYVKNKFTCFVGLVNNINFNSQYKEYDDDYYDQIGTYNYEKDGGATLYKNTFIDRTWSIQYILGFDIKMSKGNTFGVEFVDYFGYRNYYSKYFGNSYNTQRISSSAINVYVAFDLDRE